MKTRFTLLLIVILLSSVTMAKNEKRFIHALKNADAIVIAEIVEVGPPVGFWSGYMASSQCVVYEVREVLKGKSLPNRIVVGHYVVFGSLTADKDMPRLSPKFFSKGNRLVLFLKSGSCEHGECLQSEGSKNIKKNAEALFCATDESYSSALATPELIQKTKKHLGE